jgi:DHA2 family multidrug resistance protein
MATSTQMMGRPTPEQLARGIAGAVPSELSRSPILGILGVIMGAGIVTLTGRMLTLGLGDLKGSLGIGFDSGAWIGSSFNIALMFIGPFTVYLGGLIGPRRILLGCAAAFTIILTFLPFVHSYSLLITSLVLAGLASGTFYPLTLTFALRNIPIRFLPFTLALYATFVDMSVNVAPSLYGWCRNDLSWRWMFWLVAMITPVMMTCIYFGIPKIPAPKRSGAAPSFAGFLYGSAGVAMLFGAIDQGQRLDWWRSGLFSGLLFGGTFLLVCAFIRRFIQKNPLVDLPFLGMRNTLLGASGLMCFRFCLLATIILVPQTLSIHGFEADQIGPAVIWTAIPQLPIAFLAGLLLLRHLDSRLLLAMGFTCIALASWMNADLTSVWSAENFYRTELLMGVGQSFAFLGLVSTLVLQGVFSGGLLKPQWILSFSAFMHTIRLFGGEVGVSIMTHFIAQREKLYSNLLGLHVQRGNWIANDNIGGLTAGLFSRSSGLLAANGRAVGVIAGRLRLQAYTLSLIDGFHLIAWACVCALILICFLRRSPYSYGELSAIQQASMSSRNGSI